MQDTTFQLQEVGVSTCKYYPWFKYVSAFQLQEVGVSTGYQTISKERASG
ncbi:hypothetical protein [Olivibacter sitiensis]|nr:hypothetical protein [Olivibacter sitiensis]